MRLAHALVLSAALSGASSIRAGIAFRPMPAPAGADTRALASDGSGIWAATYRGVLGLHDGVWRREGLSDRPVTAIAFAEGTLWAATDEGLYRRAPDGAWVSEPLTVEHPVVLFTDGASLVVGGSGAARRSGGAWVPLPSPDGNVTALGSFSGDLVAGIAGRGAARLSGGVWIPMAAGMGPGENAEALISFGGLLLAGTSRGLYAWLGDSWVLQTGFGSHDVRGLGVLAGDLAAATLDAGVITRSGSVWGTRNEGLATTSTRCFATAGSDLYLGTAGGPIVRWSGDRWIRAGEGPDGAIVSGFADVCIPGPISCEWAVGARGAGVAGVLALPELPDGCGDVRSLVSPSWGALLAATNCGLRTRAGAAWSEADLPAGSDPISLALSASGGASVGTSNAGVFQQDQGAWVSRSEGLPHAVPVDVQRVGSDLYAVAGGALFRQSASGAWLPGPGGLPSDARIRALGAVGNEPIVALENGSVLRHDEDAGWMPDGVGLETASVHAFGGYPSSTTLAAAGTGGVFRRTISGWVPENAGLPRGVDVRVADVSFFGVSRVGTAGHGAFFGTGADALTVPVLLDAPGAAGSRFRTEIAFGNRTAEAQWVPVRFHPTPGFGSSAASSEGTFSIPAGTEVRASDALAFLRGIGLDIPAASSTNPVVGSLSVPWSSGIDVTARTFTSGSEGGSYGLSYGAVSDLDAAEDVAAVYGLRSQAGVARSNLEVVHVAGRSEAPITLEAQVYAADGTRAGGPLTKTLEPGEWFQWNEVLRLAGLPDGASGYARITRVSGTGPWVAYGVVNDDGTSDGSFLPSYRPGGLAAARRLLVPVVADVTGVAGAHFTTEITLANDGDQPSDVAFLFRPAPGFGPAAAAPGSLRMPPRSQTTIPNVLAFLGVKGAVGTLEVTFGAPPGPGTSTAAIARTTTPSPDGRGAFGVAYPAAAWGRGARGPVVVPALNEDAAVRANLAVVHLGGGSESAVTLHVQLHDADTGAAVGRALETELLPGEWHQWTRVLEAAGAAAATSRAYAVVSRTAGDDTFMAYGVRNDAVTSDGSWVAMVPSEP